MGNFSTIEAEVNRRSTAAREKGIAEFMAKPETKLLLGMIPAAENPDAVRTLLESCFLYGFGCGEAVVLVHMIERMFKAPPKQF